MPDKTVARQRTPGSDTQARGLEFHSPDTVPCPRLRVRRGGASGADKHRAVYVAMNPWPCPVICEIIDINPTAKEQKNVLLV